MRQHGPARGGRSVSGVWRWWAKVMLRRLGWPAPVDPEFVDRQATRGVRALSRRSGWIAVFAALALAGGGTAIALAADDSPSPPQSQPLDRAIAQALSSKPVTGVSADVTFTGDLFPTGTMLGKLASGLLSGSGQLWSDTGQGRIEMQTGAGPVQVVWDTSTLSIYAAALNTVYRISIPNADRPSSSASTATQPPTLAQVDNILSQVDADWTISQPQPAVVAGQPAYSVTLSAKESGSMLSSLQLSWDAQHATPLKIAVYARGTSTPAIELDVTNIVYGPVAPANLQATFPANATVTSLGSIPHTTTSGPPPTPISGLPAVSAAAGFPVCAPDSLLGTPRSGVYLHDRTVFVSYGHDLAGIALIERKADPSTQTQHALTLLPTVTVNGINAHELTTTLGTALTWQAQGVTYVLAGSVPAATLEHALPAVR